MSEPKVYPKTLDPDETRPFTFDWAGVLSSNDTIASQVVSLVDDADGAQSPSDSATGTVSRVFLTGGTSGKQIVYTVRITTVAGEVHEEAFIVTVRNSTDDVVAESNVSRITRELEEIRAYRHEVATGQAIVRMSRNGRAATSERMRMTDFDHIIQTLERELKQAQREAQGKPARRPIKLRYHR